MKQLTTIVFVGVGLLNLAPLIGVISADQLQGMYGVPIDSPDLEVLMRHRAILFGIVGGFVLFAAFRPALQGMAATAALVSMLSFILLAVIVGNVGDNVRKVVIADVIGSAALLLVLAVDWLRERRESGGG